MSVVLHGPETRMVFAVFPENTNHYHTLFGGTAMAWMDKAAFICATRWCRRRVVTARTSAIEFKHPVHEGSIVELFAKVTATGRSSMTISIEMWIEPMDRDDRVMCCSGEFVMVAVDDDGTTIEVPALTAETSID